MNAERKLNVLFNLPGKPEYDRTTLILKVNPEEYRVGTDISPEVDMFYLYPVNSQHTLSHDTVHVEQV